MNLAKFCNNDNNFVNLTQKNAIMDVLVLKFDGRSLELGLKIREHSGSEINWLELKILCYNVRLKARLM